MPAARETAPLTDVIASLRSRIRMAMCPLEDIERESSSFAIGITMSRCRSGAAAENRPFTLYRKLEGSVLGTRMRTRPALWLTLKFNDPFRIL